MKMVASLIKKKSPLKSSFFLPQPTQFWCSSLTTIIFVATTVTTSAEEKLEIWWLFLCPNWELKAPLHPHHQYALLPGCATMVEMSHTINALVFDIRDQWTDDLAALTEQSGRRVKAIITFLFTKNLGIFFLSPWPDWIQKAGKPAEFDKTN